MNKLKSSVAVKSFVLSIILLLSFLSVSQVAAVTVSCNQTITANTVIDNDLNCSGGDALKVANNVVLDCAGHTIYYNSSGVETGILLVGGALGATVKNCNVVGIGTQGTGIYSRSGKNNMVENCNVTGGNIGMMLYSGSSNTIRDCNVSGMRTGFVIGASLNCSLINVTSSTSNVSTYGYGLDIYAASNNTLIVNSTFIANGESSNGIWIFQSSNNTIMNSTGIIRAKSGSGLYLDYATGNTVIDSAGISENPAAYSAVSIKIANSNTFINSKAIARAGGVSLKVQSPRNLTLINFTVINGSTDIYELLDSTIINSTATNGFSFSRSQNNRIINSIANNYGFALYSSSYNNTFTNISADGAYMGVYMSASQNNQIINSTLNARSMGILLTSSSNNNQIINSTLSVSDSSGVGIYLSNSSNNILRNLTISATGWEGKGISLISSSNNNQIANSAISARLEGIGLYSSSDNNTITDTIASASRTGSGGFYIGRSSNNTIRNVSMSGNSIGLYLSGSTTNLMNNMVVNSTITAAESTGYGAYLSGSSNQIINSIIRSSSGTGVQFNGDNNTISNSNVSGNIYGLYFWGSSNHNIIKSNITGSSYSVYARDGSKNIIFIDSAISTAYFTGSASSLYAKWLIDISVQAIGGTSDNALVTIYDKFSTQVYSGYTDAEGRIPTQMLTEYVWNSSGKTYQTPHTIVAYKAPVTASMNVTVNTSKTVTAVLLFDAAPPVTTASVSGTAGQNGWYTSDVAVALAAIDDSSGVNATKYSFNGVSWSTYSSPLVVSTEGSSTVYYYSIDNAGNTEGIKSLNVKVDKTAPSAPVLNDPGEWDIDGNVAISWSASTDATSGMDKYKVYRCNVVTLGQTCTEAYLADAQGISYSDTGLFDANQYYYKVSAVDMAGLEGQMSNGVDIKIDKTPPLPPELGISNAIGAYVNQLTVNLGWTAAQDPGAIASGVDYYNIFKGLASGAGDILATVQETVLQYSDMAVAEGTKYYYQVNAVDNAGNTGNKSGEVFVTPDVTAPVSSASLSGVLGNAGWYVSDVTVAVSATDALSGVQRKEYDSGAGWAEYTGPVTVSSDGTTTMSYKAIDNVNNAETAKSVAVKVDKISPVSSASSTCTMGQGGWCIGDASVTISSSDATSSVLGIEYSLNGGMSWSTYTAPFTASSEGMNLILYKGTDAAGNVEVQKELVVKVDKIAPITSHSTSPDSDADGAYDPVATVALSASDSASGVVATFYSVDGGAMAAGTQFAVSGVGTHSISYYSNDAAGNSEAVKSASVRIDNCPMDYNPDQIDTDSDLKGDVCDPCPGSATDTCDVNASQSGVIGSSGGNVTTENGAVSVSIPAGTLTNDTTITLVSGASNFGVSTSTGKGNMILHYDILPAGATFSQPVTLMFHYDQGSMPEGGKKEQAVDVMYNDPTLGWVALNAAQDMVTNTLTVQVTHFSEYAVMEGADTDGDGIFDNWMGEADACLAAAGKVEWQGCPYADKSIVELHIIDLTKTKCPGGAGACKSPLEGAAVKVFDRNDAAFQARWTKNPSGIQYPDVYEADVGRIASCVTAADGTCIAGEASTGDLLVIVRYTDAETGKVVYTGKPKGLSDFASNIATKEFQVIKAYSKVGAVSFKAGDKTSITGSLLEIIYPQYTIWESYEELYPFIFISDSDWTVDVCMQIPSGYQIKYIMDDAGNLLPATQCTQSFISGGTKVVMFGIADVGSPEPNMKFKINAKDPKGKKHAIELDTPGIRKARERAEKAKGLPFIGAMLGEDSAVATGSLVAILAAIAIAIYFISKQPSGKTGRKRKV